MNPLSLSILFQYEVYVLKCATPLGIYHFYLNEGNHLIKSNLHQLRYIR
jgi:hypothetical protein